MRFTIPYDVDYYFGRLNTYEAERVLKSSHPKEGMFLLREHDSRNRPDSYVVSIYSKEKIYHYLLRRSKQDGIYIDGMNEVFIGPVEACKYLQHENIGLPVRPSTPCRRDPQILPIRYLFIGEKSFTDACEHQVQVRCKTDEEKEAARGIFHYKFEYHAMKDLFRSQVWFKEDISLEEVDRIFQNENNRKNGRFILRSNALGQFRLTVFLEDLNDYHDYKIIYDNKTFFVKGSVGEDFRFIVQLIDFYGRERGCLKHKLTAPCVDEDNREVEYDTNMFYKRLLAKDGHNLRFMRTDSILGSNMVYFNGFTLKIGPPIASGYFSKVYQAFYKSTSEPNAVEKMVAVKVLKNSERSDIKKEEQVLRALDHPNIVKLVEKTENLEIPTNNVDMSNSPVLVMEFAKLGSLRAYLKKARFTTSELLVIVRQVADALKYLVSKGKVHRDISARNILLFAKDCAKLSDFGLYKELDENNNYNSSVSMEVPIKWYPPETVLENKFCEKSEVWSFGVTLWELFSNGILPFEDIMSNEFTNYVKNFDTEVPVLSKHENCPDVIYELIKKCLAIDRHLRPTFKDICDELDTIMANYQDDEKEKAEIVKIASGAFSDVFKLTYRQPEPENIEREIVIKVFKQTNAKTIKHEQEILESFDHPNIVKVVSLPKYIDISESLIDSRKPFLCMEYAKLGTFKSYLKNNDLDPLEILIIMRQVADALSFMAQLGKIHGDVTARNILIFNKDLAKLSDIGVVSECDANNNKSAYSNGSSEYSSPLPIKWHAPEAVLFKRFSEKSDVWSFGVTLWEAFAGGATPFHDITNGRFVNYMKNIDDNSLKLYKPAECPEYVFEFINKCLIVDETNRPSFAEICTELDDIIKELQIRNLLLNS